jgi:hypothetical protein
VPLTAIGRDFGSMPRSVLENVLGGGLGSILTPYMIELGEEGWECAIESDWEHTIM